MKTHIIRDSSEARLFLTQGLWWQRVHPPTANTVRTVLGWAKEIASNTQFLIPIGCIADLGHVIFGDDLEQKTGRDAVAVPNLPMNLVRTYEDHFLGKLYPDWTFVRASDALRRYGKGREQSRGLAYLVEQFRERARFDDVELPVGVINVLLEMTPEEVLAEGYEAMRQEELHPLLPALYESLIQAARRISEVLAPEDLFDLETKAALEKPSERLAHRQVLQAGSLLEKALPRQKVQPKPGRPEVPTRILDEDQYPVGGFTSVSNRGSIESLLHSQLAYMEPDKSEHPDLFDTLYLMDELLYYSRDENQFLRRRRTFIIALCPDLVETRFKDFELPYQRGVMLLGLLFVMTTKLIEWLDTDALNFQFLFLGTGEKEPLKNERDILHKLLAEPMVLDVVHTSRLDGKGLGKYCEEWSRKSMVHCLLVGVRPPLLEVAGVVVTRLAVNAPRPALEERGDLVPAEGEDAVEGWGNTLKDILARWV